MHGVERLGSLGSTHQTPGNPKWSSFRPRRPLWHGSRGWSYSSPGCDFPDMLGVLAHLSQILPTRSRQIDDVAQRLESPVRQTGHRHEHRNVPCDDAIEPRDPDVQPAAGIKGLEITCDPQSGWSLLTQKIIYRYGARMLGPEAPMSQIAHRSSGPVMQCHRSCLQCSMRTRRQQPRVGGRHCSDQRIIP